MNKKILSAVLLGALMATSASTFVSCKDYDDDISDLQTQIDDLESTLSSLQSQVNAGKWITSLSSTASGFTVVFSDGSQYTIENGADGKDGATGATGAAGENGTIVTVNDGYWYIDGEKTDYLAVTAEDITDQVYVPYVGEDGYWYFYNEDGEAEKSTYNSLGATYAVKNSSTGVWTLYIPDADGEMQSIELPTAASKITGLTFTNANAKKFNVYNVKWTFTANGSGLTSSTWAGTKSLPSDGSYIYGATDPVEIQVSPADVAEDIETYTLINSRNVTLGLALTAEAYNGYISSDGKRTRATTNGNGLYDILIEPQVVTSGNRSTLNTLLKDADGGAIGYALVADGVFRSAYEVEINSTTEPELAALEVDGLSSAIAIGGSKTIDDAVVGTTYTVTFDDDAAVYDSYFSIDSQYMSSFGITYDNANRTFTVGKNPDTSSLDASFPMTVYTIDITGKVNKTTLTINLSSEIGSNTLTAQTVNVSTTSSFQYNLSTVGVTSSDTWKMNVDLSQTKFELYSDEACTTIAGSNDAFFTGLLAGKLASASSTTATTDVNSASRIIITINNDYASATGLGLNTTYYLKTTFKNNSGNTLNCVVLPVTFTAPALSELFTVKGGYVGNDGVVNAYFYDEGGSKTVELIRYFSDYVDDAEVELDDATTIGSTSKVSDDLATISLKRFDDAYLTLVTRTTSQYELGYGEALIVSVGKNNYKGWLYTTSAERTYTFKIRLMSPIMEGSIKPATGSTIDLKANDVVAGANITDSMIKGYDYNNNAYNVVPDLYVDGKTSDWTNTFIEDVTANEDSDGYLKDVRVVAATQSNGTTVNGYFKVTANSLSQTTTVSMPVKVTDIWGYTMTANVSVRIVVE